MDTRLCLIATAVGLSAANAVMAQRPKTPPGGPKPSAAEQEAVQKGMEALFKALGGEEGSSQSAAADLVDHRSLRALLPTELKGMKRAEVASEKSGAMGIAVSRAAAKYKGTQDSVIEIAIEDVGGLGKMGALGFAVWAAAEVDRETEDGFERTAPYKGFKAMESYDQRNRSGQIEVLVAGRFMVRVSGQRIPFEQLKAALDELDLTKLAALKPAP